MLNWKNHGDDFYTATIVVNDLNFEVNASYDAECDRYIGQVTDYSNEFELAGLNTDDNEFVEWATDLIKDRFHCQ